MKRSLKISVFLLFLSCAALTQSVAAQVVFKIPDGVFPIDWKKNGGFKGVLMLRQDSPSGVFVTYPNDGETIEALKKRTVEYIAPMFIHGEEEKKKISFQTSSIPNHKGDAGDAATYYAYANDKTMIQILVYDRIANGGDLIYGYFAMKDKTAKPDKKLWADEKGQGVKFFDKFWKTIKD
jgi:hypothetical protein